MNCSPQFFICKLLLMLALPIGLMGQGQLQVDAGEDTSFCDQGEVVIGGNPTAQGGVDPYTYRWFLKAPKIDVLGDAHWCETFLSDTTVANPEVISAYNFDTNAHIPVTIYVEVTDFLDSSNIDSINLLGKRHTLSDGKYGLTAFRGDTVTLTPGYFHSPFEPYSYSWGYNENFVSDTNQMEVRMYLNPNNWNYSAYCKITDSIGCFA